MAVEDIPESQIRNVRTSYSQYLWQLPSSSYYRWDEDITYMYRVGATPVPGQGLPPTPPPPPVQSPFTRGELTYLDGHYVLFERRVNTGAGLEGGGQLSSDLTVKLTDAVIASLAAADVAVPASAAGQGQVFIKNGSNVLTGTSYSVGVAAHTIVQRDAAGTVSTATPTQTGHAATKAYVDSNVETRVPNTRAVSAGTGMKGGGALAQDISFALSDASQASLAKADTAVQPAALTTKADLVNGVVPTSQIPSIALGTSVTVANRTAMLALTSAQVQPGDLAIDTSAQGSGSTRGTYQLIAADPSQIANWNQLTSPSDAVLSVNGQNGTVVLGKADVGLGNVDNTSDANKPISTAQGAAFGLKVDISSAAASQVHARNASGAEVGIAYGTGAAANAIPQRNASGQIDVPTPTSANNTANKSYVDAFGNQVATGGRLGATSMLKSSTDLNALLDNGWYAGSALTNAPGNDQGFFLIQVQRSTDSSFYARQQITRLGVGIAAVGVVYHRYAEGQTNGVTQWSPWIRISDVNGALDQSVRDDLAKRLGTNAFDYSGADFNTLQQAGFFRGNSMVNAPAGSTGWFYIMVQSHDGANWISQTAIGYAVDSKTIKTTWTRQKENGTWSAWVQIADPNGSVDGAIRGDINNRMRYNAFDVGAAKDLNTITDSGWCLGGSGNPNSPYSGRWLMDVRTAATGYTYQRFMSLTGIPGAVWERYTNSGSAGGSWSPWVQVVDAAGAVDPTARARADLAAFASLPSARDLYAADSWNRTRFGLTMPANQAPTLAMLYGAVPIDSTYVADGGDLGQNMGDNYVGQLRTMVRVTAAKTISMTLTHDDGAQFYVDGKSVYSALTYTQGVTVQFTLTVGWHILDWLWLEQAGGDGIFGISPTLRSQVDEMFAPVSETRRASDAASAVKTVNGTAPDANGNVVVAGGGGGGTGTVTSVNGRGPNGSGAVTLVPADIGAPPTTRSISPGTGLQGGGDLSADRTLSLSAAAQASLSKADSAVQPAGLQLLQPKRRRIAFFGDSWGTQLYSPDPAMPNMLATALNADLIANHAISGSVLGPVGTSNTGGIERNTDTMVNNAKADTSYDKNSITDVVLVIGVNNILTYFPSMAQAITNFKNIAALYPNARFWYAANSKKSINMTGDTDPWKFYSRFMEAASLAGWAAANSSPQWTWGVTADTATWWPSDSVATTRHPTTAGLQAYAGRLAGFMEGESWKPFFRVPMTIHPDAVALNSAARISNDTTRVDGTLLMLDFAVASMSNASASTSSYQNAASIPERYAPNVPFYYTPVGTREGGGAMNFTYAGQVGAASGIVSVDARVVRTNVSYFVFHAAVPLNAFLALDAS